MLGRGLGAARRSAMTLVEVVVTVAVLAIFTTVVVVNVEGSSLPGGDVKRIEDAAEMLERLRDAAVRYNYGDPSAVGGLSARTILGDTSFTAKISGVLAQNGGVNPGRLSQLTNKIGNADLNSCGWQFTSTYAPNWMQNFFNRPISTAGIKLADGFIADDLMERYNPAGVQAVLANGSVTGAGTLAIVIRNVSLADAQALAQLMEGAQPATLGSGNFAVVRFTPSGNAPVIVRYHMAIHGC